ncbi:hypothetical protein LVD15_03900 [Fulvivirga maritima]|uniref:hypothetical protein n=1 Tax=Fulvivirga maritima TaxID=2904247 RepID=UPI001F2A225F|nr:hypothetical protein [Fulvivirga maritima]UII27579.1 hypothetical protein LVD15_03900 [Fulvivirga maritima]
MFFSGAAGNLIASGDYFLGDWVATRSDKLMNGASQLHKSFMNLADDAPMYANRFLSGSKTLRLANGLRVAGQVAGGIGIGLTIYQYGAGQISGTQAVVESIIGGVGIFGGPVGAVVSISYFGGKMMYEYYTGETVTY